MAVVEIGAQLFELRDIALLDVSEVGYIPLRGRHILRDAAAKPHDLDRLVAAGRASVRIAGCPAVGEESVEIGVADTIVGRGTHLSEVDAQFLRPGANRRTGQNFGRSPTTSIDELTDIACEVLFRLRVSVLGWRYSRTTRG